MQNLDTEREWSEMRSDILRRENINVYMIQMITLT